MVPSTARGVIVRLLVGLVVSFAVIVSQPVSVLAWMGATSDGAYRWSHSAVTADPDAPAWAFVPLVNLIGATELADTDDGFEVVALTSPFAYYGTSYSQIWVCHNGLIKFSDPNTTGGCDFTPERLPAGSVNAIAGYWTDLDNKSPHGGGGVWVWQDANTTIIHWEAVQEYASAATPMSGTVTMQIVLVRQGLRAGTILVSYGAMAPVSLWNLERNGAVVGLSNTDGSQGATLFHHHNGTALANSMFLLSPCTAGTNVDGDGVDACLDCDDTNARIGAASITQYPDYDDDLFGDTTRPLTTCYAATALDHTDTDGDCDDQDAAINPGVAEVTCDTIDNDCDPGTLDQPDADGDGDVVCTDCDDTDPLNSTLLPEVCDGRDNDCDTVTDNGLATSDWYADADDDGFGGAFLVNVCDGQQPAGSVTDNTDCDDGDPTSFPGNPELCDGVDNDCDTTVDNGLATLEWYPDVDQDGAGDGTATATVVCDGQQPAGTVLTSNDCDDSDRNNFPGNAEICDGSDNDCDAVLDNGLPVVDWYTDADMDGEGDQAGTAVSVCDGLQPMGSVANNTDCDDDDAANYSSNTEICDLQDNNCDTEVDEGFADNTYYDDTDGDGYGDATMTIMACTAPAGYVADDTDCDVGEMGINPGATEIDGDGIDQNCDGLDAATGLADLSVGDLVVSEIMVAPDAVEIAAGQYFELHNVTTSSVDLAGLEIFGTDTTTATDVVTALVIPAGGYVVFALNGDESMNGGVVVDYEYSMLDLASDTRLAVSFGSVVFDEVLWDADDTFPRRTGASWNLDPSSLDAMSNDMGASWCSSLMAIAGDPPVDLGTPGAANDDCPTDDDGDGYGSVATGGMDCDDASATTYPGAMEMCDGVDNDCNDMIDDEIMFMDYYVDADSDTFGDATAMATSTCDGAPEGFVANNTDCNDSESSINPVATDAPGDGIDQNCDGADTPVTTNDAGPGRDSGASGRDGGTATGDGSTVGADGGVVTTSDSGCSCRTGGSGSGPAFPVLLVLSALAFRRRR